MKNKNNFNFLSKTLFIIVILAIVLPSCKKDKVEPKDDDLENAVVLNCNHFNQDQVLTKVPNAKVDYVIDCLMEVGEANITVEPGVVIAFKSGAGIVVDGSGKSKCSFNAIGTAEKPIVFRGAEQEKGYWKGVYFSNNDTINELSYVKIQDAGQSSFANEESGNLVLNTGAKIKLSNSELSNGKSYGLNVSKIGVNFTITNNKFTGNKNPLLAEISYLNEINPTNTYNGNDEKFITLLAQGTNSSINDESTWYKNDVKYRVEAKNTSQTEVFAQLTIQPGVEIEFSPAFQLKIRSNGGSLIAVGDNTNGKIKFTRSSNSSGLWRGIYIDSQSASNKIAYAEFELSGLHSPEANICLWKNAALEIHDVSFIDIQGCGINYKLDEGQEENPNLTIGDNVESTLGCVTNVWN